MELVANISPRLFDVGIPIHPDDDQAALWRFLLPQLLFVFEGQQAELVTIDPWEHSVGYELPNHELYTHQGRKFLINRNVVLTKAVLDLILEAEDIKMALIWLVLKGDPVAVIKNYPNWDNVKEEVIVVECDGKCFYWYNPSSKTAFQTCLNYCQPFM